MSYPHPLEHTIKPLAEQSLLISLHTGFLFTYGVVSLPIYLTGYVG